MNVACGCWIPEEQQREHRPLWGHRRKWIHLLYLRVLANDREKKKPWSRSPQPSKTSHAKYGTRVQINTILKKWRIIEKYAKHIILLQVLSCSQLSAAYHSYKICLSISMNSVVKVFAWLIFQVNDSQGTWEKDLCQWYTGSANCQRVLLCS